MASGYTRTTITVPTRLLEAADQAVREGRARNRNELFVAAIRRELDEQERTKIDAGFSEWPSDPEAEREALEIAAEFAHSDWEALEAGDVPAGGR